MCGNLGLLLVGRDESLSAEKAVEEMARVVAMRGAQSYGFVCSSSSVMKGITTSSCQPSIVEAAKMV